MLSTIKKRTEAVAQANANAALEGLEPEALDLDMQARFIAGEIGIEDMLEEIRGQAVEAGKGAAS